MWMCGVKSCLLIPCGNLIFLIFMFLFSVKRGESPSWNYAMAEEMSDAYYLSGISLDAGLQ